MVRVRAKNANGWEAFSQENTIGALIENPPMIPVPVFDQAASSNTVAVFEWP